jgi:hypothetical protein
MVFFMDAIREAGFFSSVFLDILIGHVLTIPRPAS